MLKKACKRQMLLVRDISGAETVLLPLTIFGTVGVAIAKSPSRLLLRGLELLILPLNFDFHYWPTLHYEMPNAYNNGLNHFHFCIPRDIEVISK